MYISLPSSTLRLPPSLIRMYSADPAPNSHIACTRHRKRGKTEQKRSKKEGTDDEKRERASERAVRPDARVYLYITQHSLHSARARPRTMGQEQKSKEAKKQKSKGTYNIASKRDANKFRCVWVSKRSLTLALDCVSLLVFSSLRAHIYLCHNPPPLLRSHSSIRAPPPPSRTLSSPPSGFYSPFGLLFSRICQLPPNAVFFSSNWLHFVHVYLATAILKGFPVFVIVFPKTVWSNCEIDQVDKRFGWPLL